MASMKSNLLLLASGRLLSEVLVDKVTSSLHHPSDSHFALVGADNTASSLGAYRGGVKVDPSAGKELAVVWGVGGRDNLKSSFLTAARSDIMSARFCAYCPFRLLAEVSATPIGADGAASLF